MTQKYIVGPYLVLAVYGKQNNDPHPHPPKHPNTQKS